MPTDPGAAQDLRDKGVRVRLGDFDDAASLGHAFEGATRVLIISSNVAAKGGNPIAQHRTAIDAAQASGAQRVVYTSHMAASATVDPTLTRMLGRAPMTMRMMIEQLAGGAVG